MSFRYKNSKINYVLITILSVIIMCNLNGIFGMYLGITAPFSPLILILTSLIIVLSKPKKSDFSVVYLLGLSFFVLYWVLGMMGTMIYFLEMKFIVRATRENFTSLIILSSYFIYIKSLQNDKAAIDRFMKMIFFLFLITSCFGVLETLLGYRSIYKPEAERSFGFFGNPNETGLQCNLLMILAYFNFLSNRIKLPIFFAALVIGAFGAFASFSKMAILLMIIGVFFFVFYSLFSLKKFKSTLRYKFLGMISIIFAIVIFVIIPGFVSYGSTLKPSQIKRINALYTLVLEGKINSETTSHRSVVVEEAIEKILEKPILGHGLDSFSSSRIFQSGFGVHNTFLKIVGEAGVIVLFIYLLYFFGMALTAFTRLRFNYEYFVFALILILFVYSMSSHTVLARKFFIPLLGIATAFCSIPVLYKSRLQRN